MVKQFELSKVLKFMGTTKRVRILNTPIGFIIVGGRFKSGTVFKTKKQAQAFLKKKSTTPSEVLKELMGFKSFRESTPATREMKLRRAIQKRRKR